MVGLGRFITAAVTLGCATLAAGQATYSPAALTGALAGLALRLEDLYVCPQHIHTAPHR